MQSWEFFLNRFYHTACPDYFGELIEGHLIETYNPIAYYLNPIFESKWDFFNYLGNLKETPLHNWYVK